MSSKSRGYWAKPRERDEAGRKWRDEHRAELDAWDAKKSAVEKEFDCEIDNHCSDDYSMPFICVAEAKYLAWRGDPKEIDPLVLQAAPVAEWDAKLERFMSELGIEKPHESPKWWLVSYWG